MSQVLTQTTTASKNDEFDHAMVELKSIILEGKMELSSINRRIFFLVNLIKGMPTRNHTVDDLRSKLKQIVGNGKFDEEMFHPSIIFLANRIIDGKIDREAIAVSLRAKNTSQ